MMDVSGERTIGYSPLTCQGVFRVKFKKTENPAPERQYSTLKDRIEYLLAAYGNQKILLAKALGISQTVLGDMINKPKYDIGYSRLQIMKQTLHEDLWNWVFWSDGGPPPRRAIEAFRENLEGGGSDA